MADPSFRDQQDADKYAAHIAPINSFVDSLSGERWMPYVAPLHGGLDAKVLSILRDPGPKAHADHGSGFICVENDDPTAERQAVLLEEFGISPRDVLPWNAYPWYVNRAPRAAELEQGADVILQLISMMRKPSVVLLQGRHAEDVWRRVVRRDPQIVEHRNLVVVDSIHPSRSALWHHSIEVRELRVARQRAAYARVADVLGVTP